VSGNIVTRQITPMVTCALRQPTASIRACTSGGHTVPARYEPQAQIDTASPRRFSNQCEMSASSGPKVALLPRKPTSTPCASAYTRMFGAKDAAT
jgi:hypothetical protein